MSCLHLWSVDPGQLSLLPRDVDKNNDVQYDAHYQQQVGWGIVEDKLEVLTKWEIFASHFVDTSYPAPCARSPIGVIQKRNPVDQERREKDSGFIHPLVLVGVDIDDDEKEEIYGDSKDGVLEHPIGELPDKGGELAETIQGLGVAVVEVNVDEMCS